MKKLILLICVLLFSAPTWAYNFSDTQIKNMSKAYQYGKKKLPTQRYGNLDHGYIMAAILWQESSAGINCGKNGHAVGPFQNYIPTVKSRMKQNGVTKSNSQIASELSSFNNSAHWANVELDYWLTVHKGNINKAIASYNAGWQIQKGQGYSRSVIQKANYLKSNNILKVEK